MCGEEHQNLLDLLEARDRSGLQQAIKRHMQKAVQDLVLTREPSGNIA